MKAISYFKWRIQWFYITFPHSYYNFDNYSSNCFYQGPSNWIENRKFYTPWVLERKICPRPALVKYQKVGPVSADLGNKSKSKKKKKKTFPSLLVDEKNKSLEKNCFFKKHILG